MDGKPPPLILSTNLLPHTIVTRQQPLTPFPKLLLPDNISVNDCTPEAASIPVASVPTAATAE